MQVLVADALAEGTVEDIRRHGHDCADAPELAGPALAERVADPVAGPEALVVRSTPVPAATVDGAARLELIVRAGSGTDTIDLAAAGARGVAVSNVPGRNADAVAELAIGLLIAVDRRIPDNVADLRAGWWDKRRYRRAEGLRGRALGVVGLGAVGLAVAERAAAFGLDLYGLRRPGRESDRRRRIHRLGIELVDDLPALAGCCDVLSFHVPVTPDTRGLIGEPLLDHVRPGTILLNTSRGEIMDGPSLLAAIDRLQLWVGTDVFPDEPAAARGAFHSPLAQHPRVYGTHHIGASTRQAQRAVGAGVVAILDAYADGHLRSCVNRDRLRPREPADPDLHR